jgi:protein-S-isoprenylcysteine O-methyltransferase Ste14
MNTRSLAAKVLGPGYGIIVAGSVLENFVLRTDWFMLGSVVGFLWLAAGLVALILALRELKRGEGYMLVESGPFAWSRNPVMASNLFGIMPGLCLIAEHQSWHPRHCGGGVPFLQECRRRGTGA